MSDKNLRKLIENYLDEQKLMQLASIDNGNPWICSVWQASDEDLNIYFFSSVTRRHSKEIQKDERVAGALALPQTPDDNARGLQFEGVARRLVDDEEIKKARSRYEGRIFDTETVQKFMDNKEKPHMFYKITPSNFVLFDTVNFLDEPRQEYKL